MNSKAEQRGGVIKIDKMNGQLGIYNTDIMQFSAKISGSMIYSDYANFSMIIQDSLI